MGRDLTFGRVLRTVLQGIYCLAGDLITRIFILIFDLSAGNIRLS